MEITPEGKCLIRGFLFTAKHKRKHFSVSPNSHVRLNPLENSFENQWTNETAEIIITIYQLPNYD